MILVPLLFLVLRVLFLSGADLRCGGPWGGSKDILLVVVVVRGLDRVEETGDVGAVVAETRGPSAVQGCWGKGLVVAAAAVDRGGSTHAQISKRAWSWQGRLGC